MIDLPPKLNAVHELLASGMDTPVEEIYATIYGEKPSDELRQPYHYIGTYITRLNRRLAPHGQRITPGRVKRTYRLVRDR